MVYSIRRPSIHCAFVLVLLALLVPVLTFAQGTPPPPIDQPPEFATVRANYEHLTPQEIAAAGYQVEPVCVSSPMGGMGFHAVNRQILEAQFASGQLDPQVPPILLLDANQRVVGLEWEAASNTQPPMLFGQTIELLPGHPGLEEPHYMLHAYFRPNGQVLFATWDPQLTCPPGAGAPPDALPDSGSLPATSLLLLILTGIGTSLIGVGIARRSLRSHRA